MTAHVDEAERQRALDIYHVVDTFPEAAFDDIVCLASQLCKVPIALISLIDRDRQWFKAREGLPVSETSRDVALCDHAIRMPDTLLVVPNALEDARFSSNPLVTGDLMIRFYAGMPLVTPGGAAIGTVCVIDHTPRTLDESQRKGMAALARLTMNLLETRHRQRELERAILFAADTATGSLEPDTAFDLEAANQCTIAIVELQDLSEATHKIGERAMRRALAQLEQLLHTGLRPQLHDSVNHVTGSPELIVMLHGSDTADTLAALRERVAAFEREHSLVVLVAAAHSMEVNEPLESIYLRADLALSQAKDVQYAE